MWLMVLGGGFLAMVLTGIVRYAAGHPSAASAGPSPRVPKDPRAVAWLRGGYRALIELVTYSLMRRDLLRVKPGAPFLGGPALELTGQDPGTDALDALETAILLACQVPQTRPMLAMHPLVLARLSEVEVELQDDLAQRSLAVSRISNSVRIGYGIGILLLLAAIFLPLLFRPVIRDQDVAVVVVGYVTTLLTVSGLSLPMRATVWGKKALRDLEREQSQGRLRLLYDSDFPADRMLLRATFGMEVPLGRAEGPAFALPAKPDPTGPAAPKEDPA